MIGEKRKELEAENKISHIRQRDAKSSEVGEFGEKWSYLKTEDESGLHLASGRILLMEKTER